MASLVTQMVKNTPAIQETNVWSLGQEDLLEKEMATHSSILAWRIPWPEEPGWLQSMESLRVGHNWAINTATALTAANELSFPLSFCLYLCLSSISIPSSDTLVWFGFALSFGSSVINLWIFCKHIPCAMGSILMLRLSCLWTLGVLSCWPFCSLTELNSF